MIEWRSASLDQAIALAKHALDSRAGTSNGDVNVFALPVTLPRWALETLLKIAEAKRAQLSD